MFAFHRNNNNGRDFSYSTTCRNVHVDTTSVDARTGLAASKHWRALFTPRNAYTAHFAEAPLICCTVHCSALTGGNVTPCFSRAAREPHSGGRSGWWRTRRCLQPAHATACESKKMIQLVPRVQCVFECVALPASHVYVFGSSLARHGQAKACAFWAER